jgi:guanylate kinase/adenylate cyclase class IV
VDDINRAIHQTARPTTLTAKNIEFKAYCADPVAAQATCARIGARLARSGEQKDTYFLVRKGRLKVRQCGVDGDSLIYYDRLDSPGPRESLYRRVPIAAQSDHIIAVLESAIGVRTTVQKHRDAYEWKNTIINVDDVTDVGQFLEAEVDVGRLRSLDEALQVADEVKGLFGVSPADIVSWSYADLRIMYQASRRWRGLLDRGDKRGECIFLDGPSCSGKTTLARRVLADRDLRLQLIPRYCTRKPRPGERGASEYVFVSRDRFSRLAEAGAFIEYRDFQFGMSYGLPWKQAVSAVRAGSNAIGIMNLGSIRHVKRVFPEAVTILVTASEDTIRKRLLERGVNTTAQIEERIQNARLAPSYVPWYDYVVHNEDGMLPEAEQLIRHIVRSRARNVTASR